MAAIAFEDQPSMTLVSNGADCVLISKQFYLRYVSPDAFQHMRMMVSVLLHFILISRIVNIHCLVYSYH